MSIKECKLDGKPGWQWGSGTCHTYDPSSAGGSAVAKAKALKDGSEAKKVPAKEQDHDGQVQI